MQKKTGETIFQDLMIKLLDNVDEDTGCIRTVYDRGVEYQIYVAEDGDLEWYIALIEDGTVISFGIDYKTVVQQAEKYVDIIVEQMDNESEDDSQLEDEYDLPVDRSKLN